MGKPNFSNEFERDAVVQISERGYPVAEVLQRLGISPDSVRCPTRLDWSILAGRSRTNRANSSLRWPGSNGTGHGSSSRPAAALAREWPKGW